MLVITVALLMIIVMPILATTIEAQTLPRQITTYAKITVQPEVIGINQRAMGYAFLGNAPLAGSTMVNQYRFRNYTVWITDPEGKVETKHWDIVDDTTGCQMFSYTPTIVGQYNVTFTFGGMTLTREDTGTAANIGNVYLPSTANCTFYAQEDPIFEFPNSYPMPTEYWTRPIYGENPDWFKISSSWLGTGAPVNSKTGYGTISGTGGQSAIQRYPGDAVGSKTGHVMWTKPMQSGGVVGGETYEIDGQTFFEGSAYINRFQNPIIVAGMLIYREPLNFASAGGGDTVCVNIASGKEIWRSTTMPTLSFATMPDVQNPNQHGVFPPMIATSNWGRVFDAYTGYPMFNVTNMPTGTLVQGPNGEHIRYTFFNNGTASAPNYYLCMWNSTLMWGGIGYHPGETGSTPAIQTQTVNGVTSVIANQGRRYNWIDSQTQNVSIPWRTQNQYSGFSVVAAYYNDIMICRNGTYPTLTGQMQNVSGVVSMASTSWTYFAIDINTESNKFGQVIWTSPTYSSPQDKTITWAGSDPVAEVFMEGIKETTQFVGYSMRTGKQLWTTEGQTTLDYFGNPSYPYAAAQSAYGRLYSLNFGGLLYCYNETDGKLLWTYGNGGPGNSTQSGLQAPGYYPGFIMGVGDDVVYIAATQHTITTPIPKGNFMRGINATTGEEIWTISDYTGTFTVLPYAMADGYSSYFNGYDNQVYTVGRGPTSLTVTAPDLSAEYGQPVVIRGTVYDVSSGTKQDEQAARFAKGVGVASDECMADWMGYIYQNKPLPVNFTGVDVTIYVVDSNNNYHPIGTATTDSTGAYSLIWKPDIPGAFSVTAVFQGTNGYWPSRATTAFNVMDEKVTPAPTETPPSITDTYFIPSVIGIIVAILIVGIATIFLLLRKRP